MKLHVGIDPGLDGAVAAISDCGGEVKVYDIPKAIIGNGKKRKAEVNMMGLRLLLEDLLDRSESVTAYVESVHSMPKQGVASSFNFGKTYGILLGMLAALKIPFRLVTPQEWKKTMMNGQGKEKDASVYVAGNMFPHIDLSMKKHHNRADALLIAQYGKQTSNS